jgi:hypothetical protein
MSTRRVPSRSPRCPTPERRAPPRRRSRSSRCGSSSVSSWWASITHTKQVVFLTISLLTPSSSRDASAGATGGRRRPAYSRTPSPRVSASGWGWGALGPGANSHIVVCLTVSSTTSADRADDDATDATAGDCRLRTRRPYVHGAVREEATTIAVREIQHGYFCGSLRYDTVVLSHVPSDTSRADWTSPDYVATVVGVLAVGALAFFAALTRSDPTVDDVTFVVLSITVPVTFAYELARRRR